MTTNDIHGKLAVRDGNGLIDSDGTGKMIARTWALSYREDHREPNARLIAHRYNSFPAMLEALKEIAGYGEGFDHARAVECVVACAKAARAAIAQAEGRA